jgi:rhomboid family protein
MVMIFEILSRLARVRMTLSYAAALVTVSIVLLVLGPRVRAQVVGQASTNLHNLAHGHLATLFGSAFVTDSGPIYYWLPWLVCLLALAELIWRSGRLAMVFVTGHIGTTLLVATGLTAAIELRWLPLSIARASDVGMSYGAVAVLGALTAAIPRRWQPAWIGWWVPAGIASAIVASDFTDVGHAVALVLGMLVATRLGTPVRWTRVRCTLLGVSAAFGFLLLAHTGWSALVGAIIGALGALVAELITRSGMVRRPLSVGVLAAREPVLNG